MNYHNYTILLESIESFCRRPSQLFAGLFHGMFSLLKTIQVAFDPQPHVKRPSMTLSLVPLRRRPSKPITLHITHCFCRAWMGSRSVGGFEVTRTEINTSFLSGPPATGKEDLQKILDAGGDDYMASHIRPMCSSTLGHRPAESKRISKREQTLEANCKQERSVLRYLATHDPLTKLLNRAMLMETLQDAVRAAREEIIVL